MTTTSNPVRVVVADDHPIILEGLIHLMDIPNFKVVAACKEGAAALDAIRQHHPELGLLDFRMPKMTGLGVLQALSHDKLKTRIVILTGFASDLDLLMAVSHGVYGIVTKESPPNVLVECLLRVVAGYRCVPAELIRRALNCRIEVASIINALTVRQQELMTIVAEGVSNKQLAHQLGISEGTAKLHVHNIYARTGLKSRSALVELARLLKAETIMINTKKPKPNGARNCVGGASRLALSADRLW
jgi:DNA-binding NarL/FixJ family response regulator